MTETEQHDGPGGHGPRPQTPEPVSPDSSGPEPPRIADFAPPSGDVAVEELSATAVPPRAVARRWALVILGLLGVAIIACVVGLFRLAHRGLPPQPVAVAPLVSPSVSPDGRTLGEEVLRNSGFEGGLEPWGYPGGWWAISTATNHAHSGQQAAMVSNRTESWHGIGQSLLGRIEAGRVYHCSAWVRIENAPEALVTIHVTKVDDSKNGAMRHRFIGSRTVVENEWTEIHGTYVLDDMAGVIKSLFFSIAGPPPGVNLLVDDVSVKPVVE